MIYLLILSINIILVFIYGIFIKCHISRLSLMYLLFALFVPFIGVLCMFVTEFGLIGFDEEKRQNIEPPPKKVDNVLVINEYTRETILNAIKLAPTNLTEILKTALKSSDPEVVHISASALMKLQTQYLKKINETAEKYKTLPDNRQYLNEYIIALDEYIDTDIPEEQVKEKYINKSLKLNNLRNSVLL